MRINSAIPKVNFNAIYKIKVDKDIFSYPDNALACKEQFRNDIFPRLDDFIKYKHNYCIFFESVGHEYSLRRLKQNGLGYCSVDWLNQNTQSDIKLPEDEDFHTFCVFTDDDEREISKKVTMSKFRYNRFLTKIATDIIQDKILGNKDSDFLLAAKAAEALDKKMEEVVQDKPVKVYYLSIKESDIENNDKI